MKNTQEEKKMADNITPVVNETKPVSDEVSVITEERSSKEISYQTDL